MRERIESRELAEVMAYAEAPFREIAHTATESAIRMSALADGEQSALLAGQRHVWVMQRNLGGYLLVKSIVTEQEQEQGDGTDVYFGRAELYAFALQQQRDPKTARTFVSTTWNLLGRSYINRQYNQQFGELPTAPAAERSDSPLKYKIADGVSWRADTAQLEVRSLVELLRNFDTARRHNPRKSITEHFGANWGKARITFLKDFLRYKLDQLEESPPHG